MNLLQLRRHAVSPPLALAAFCTETLEQDERAVEVEERDFRRGAWCEMHTVQTGVFWTEHGLQPAERSAFVRLTRPVEDRGHWQSASITSHHTQSRLARYAHLGAFRGMASSVACSSRARFLAGGREP